MSDDATTQGGPGENDVPDRFSVDFTGLTLLGIYDVSEKLLLERYTLVLAISPSRANQLKLQAQQYLLERVLEEISVHPGINFEEEDRLATLGAKLGLTLEQTLGAAREFRKGRGLN